MKSNPMGRRVKAAMLSLGVALGVTACSNDYTVSYVYMATAKTLPHGLINAYQVDYQSGYLYVMPDSPIDSGGRDTVALVVAPNNLFMYSVNNFDSDVVEFAIGTDGKLYPAKHLQHHGQPAHGGGDRCHRQVPVCDVHLPERSPHGQSLRHGAVYAGEPRAGRHLRSSRSIRDNSLGTPTTVNVGRNPVGILPPARSAITCT
jgi:6-phosphogluconolactonase